VFAAWGLSQLVLGLACLALLLEQAGRKLLQFHWPVERVGSPPGTMGGA
jgi:hypothetical protein